ncbi:MAG TPA: MFS transporter [Acidimicrobiales bacterium]|nr:MFS transporter [Acidimicrobiales bacterium]
MTDRTTNGPAPLAVLDGGEAAPRPARRGYGHPWLTLVAVSFGLMMVGLDNTIVAVANPTIGRHFGASLGGLQWVTNAYLLAVATGLITGGKLGDRFGRKRIFLIGTAGFALASLACGLSASLSQLVAFRVVQGLFGAMLLPQTLAILRATFPAERLAQAVGFWAGASSVAIASGPIIGGLLVEHVSWQAIFFVNLPVAALSVTVGSWVIRDSKDLSSGRGFDLPGVLLLSGGLFSLIWGLIQAETHGWGSTAVLSFLVAAAVLLAGFVVRQRVAVSPLIPLNLFSSARFSAGVGLVVAVAFCLFGVLFYITLYLQRVHGYSPVGAGVRMLALTAVIGVSAPLGGTIVGRIGPRLPLTAGFLLIAGGLAGLSQLGPSSSYLGIWPWFVLMGLAVGMVQTGASQAIVGSAPRDRAGIASGVQTTALQIGAVLGTSILGTIMASRVASVFTGKLVSDGVPTATAHQLASASHAVAQGIVPTAAGSPTVTRAVTNASLTSFTSGLETAFLVGSAVALVAALVAFVAFRSPAPSPSAVEIMPEPAAAA